MVRVGKRIGMGRLNGKVQENKMYNRASVNRTGLF